MSGHVFFKNIFFMPARWSQHAVPSQELVISCAKDGRVAAGLQEDSKVARLLLPQE